MLEPHDPNQKPGLSIAILVMSYNHADYIEQCLSSLLVLDFSDRHIWVLDDGSSDATPEIVRRMSAANGGITLITQPNSGGRTSLNAQRLLDSSNSKYVLFISGDDMLSPGFPLRKFYDFLEEHLDMCLAIPRVIQINESSTSDCPARYDKNMRKILHSGDPQVVVEQHLYKRVSSLFIQGMLLRREAIRLAGGFDTDFAGDDYVLICKLFFMMEKNHLRFRYFETAFWLYRIHGNNIHKNPLRQTRIITETVGRYIPRQCWDDFAWHFSPMPNVKEIYDAERMLIDNLGREYAAKAFAKLVQRSLEHWIGSHQFAKIKELFLQDTPDLMSKVALAKTLLFALPRGLVLAAVKVPAFSSAIRQLARAAKSDSN